MDGEQQHKAGAPVGRRGRGPIRTKKAAMHCLFVKRSRTKSGRQMIVMRDDQTVLRVRRGHANAKAEPSVAFGDDQMVVGSKAYLSEAIKAGQQRDSVPGIGSRQHDDIGCGCGRPQGWCRSRIGARDSGESSGSIARPDPPVLCFQERAPWQCVLLYRHDRAGSRHCVADTPAQNPHSHGVDTDLRSMVTAMTNHRT